MGEETEVRKSLGILFGEETLVKRALKRLRKKTKKELLRDSLEAVGHLVASGAVVSMIGAALIMLYSGVEEMYPQFRPRIFEALENMMLQVRYNRRGPKPAPPQVVIVAIDEASMKKLGRWPWPRVVLARLLDKIREQKPAVVAMDILFMDPEANENAARLKESSDQLSKALESATLSDDQRKALEDLKAAVDKSIENAGGDAALAEAMQRFNPDFPILAYMFATPGAGKEADPGTDITKEQIGTLHDSAYHIVTEACMGQYHVSVPLPPRIYYPVDAIASSTTTMGHVTVTPDSDGTLRHLDIAHKFEGNYYPPLSMATLVAYYAAMETRQAAAKGVTISEEKDLDLGNRANILVERRGDELYMKMGRQGQKEIPLDSMARVDLNFYGPNQQFTYVSLIDVLEGKNTATLENKIVLIGSTAIGTFDHYPTPYSTHFPGVEVHATFLGNAIEGNFLKKVEWLGRGYVLYYILGTLGIAAFIGWSVRYLRALVAVMIVAAFIGGWVYASLKSFEHHYQIHTATPLVVMAGTLSVALTRRAVGEERERRRMKKIFQPYVSPELLKVLLDNPNLLKLGGERRIATVLFSDVAGFTSMSEKLKPAQLVLIMNEYLGEMTRAITAAGGFTDKYIGDGIMADFGIPVPHEDHAARACRSAVDQIQRLEGLNVRFKERGLPVLGVRIGIHTGELTAGNFGSEERMNFTVMGDCVNLASRLEGVNKEYGTAIIISEDTFRAAHTAVEVRELDLVRVVGRANPEAIYEVIGIKGKVPDLKARVCAEYERGLMYYRERDWDMALEAFKAGLEVDPKDGPCRGMIKRCDEYKVLPPPKTWEGVYDLTHK